jgi:AcrR family transcriptional regulator
MAAGLRERKKSATKEALSRAALNLALERGLAGVTAEAIADVVEVSPRTFHNYFTSKEDAVLFVLDRAVHSLVGAFGMRHPAESVLDSLEAVLCDFVESAGVLDRMVAVTRLMAEHPTLVARHVATLDSTSDAMLAEIGRRTRTDPDVDLYPRLVYHATNAVTRAVIELQIKSGPDAVPTPALTDLVHAGFAQLRGGLPAPTAEAP